MKKFFLLPIFVLFLNFGFAQSLGLLHSVSSQQSPEINGMGNIGAGLPSNDPFAVLYNPANGIKDRDGISLVLSNLTTGPFNDKQSIQSLSFIPDKYPFQVNLSHIQLVDDKGIMNYEEDFSRGYKVASNYYTLSGLYNASIYKIPVNLALGITGKKTSLDYFAAISGDTLDFLSDEILYDLGFLFSIPYSKKNLKIYNRSYNLLIQPAFGYSILNTGNNFRMYNTDSASPRLVNMGISLSARLSTEGGWNILDMQYGQAAQESLVKSENYPIIYKSGLGDIDIFNDIMLNNPAGKASVMRGGQVSLLNIYSFRVGKHYSKDHPYYLSTEILTRGYGIHSDGIFRLLNFLTGKKIFQQIAFHTDISYNSTKFSDLKYDHYDNKKCSAFNFSINHLGELFK
jgi:hypothetical protein